jgi:hypothetical protein
LLHRAGSVTLLSSMLFQFIFMQMAYWLALSSWFGGVLFVAASAPIIFRTIRQSDPLLPTVLSVNLEGQHSTLLANTIVGNLLAMLFKVEIGCAALLLITVIAQWFTLDLHDGYVRTCCAVRSILLLTAISVALYDSQVIWPRVQQSRQEYLDHADEPEIANPAIDRFDRYHRDSVTLLSVLLFVLLGMILFSANIVPAVHPVAITP